MSEEINLKQGGGVNPDISKALNSINSRINSLENIGVTWKLLTSFTPSTRTGTQTITGCTPNKPLYIIGHVPAFSWAWNFVVPISGTTTNMPNWTNKTQSQFLIGGIDGNHGSNCIVLIPTSSTVAVTFYSNYNDMTLYVYN